VIFLHLFAYIYRVLAKASYVKIIIKHCHSSLVPWGLEFGQLPPVVRRTQLAVVRRKSTKVAVSPISGTVTKLTQLTRKERHPLGLLEPFPFYFQPPE
jgi:hypothetical protein